jgi:hypothetical protein
MFQNQNQSQLNQVALAGQYQLVGEDTQKRGGGYLKKPDVGFD